jgi:hypothetical protein
VQTAAHNDEMAKSLPPPEPPPPSPPRNSYAVAAFVLGLLSMPFYLFGIVSILAVVAGVLGLKPPRGPPNIVTMLVARAELATLEASIFRAVNDLPKCLLTKGGGRSGDGRALGSPRSRGADR